MKKLILSAAILAASITLVPAFARYPTTIMISPQPWQSSVYISGDVGYGALSTPNSNLIDPDGIFIESASNSNSSVSAGGNIGFRRAVTRSFLVGSEFGYDYNGRAQYDENFWVDYFSTDYASYKVVSQDLHLLATGTLMLPSGFNLFGKAGVARVDQKLRITNQLPFDPIPYLATEQSLVQYKPMVAGGVGYQFGVVGIYGQYSHIFGTNASNFNDFIDPTSGQFTQVVSVDTFKVGLSVNLRV